MFRKKQKMQRLDYDREKYQPVIKCSICTGEQVAGFKENATGKFKEVMLIRSGQDLEYFMQMYNLDAVPKEY